MTVRLIDRFPSHGAAKEIGRDEFGIDLTESAPIIVASVISDPGSAWSH